jgi:hypothetical protein
MSNKDLSLGTFPSSAIPFGVTGKTTIERGHGYYLPKLYNVEITVLETVHGAEAKKHLDAQNISTELLKTDFKPVLTRIRMGYFNRGKATEGQHAALGGGAIDVVYTLPEGQFVAFSEDGATEYDVIYIQKQPQPELIGYNFSPGDTREGWILLQVPEDENNPLLAFKREHIEGVYGIWGYIWFHLY